MAPGSSHVHFFCQLSSTYYDSGFIYLREHAVVPDVPWVAKIRRQYENPESFGGTWHLCEGSSCEQIEAFPSLCPAQP